MLRHATLLASVLATVSSAVAGPIRRQSPFQSSFQSGQPVPIYSMDNSVFDGSSSTISSFPQTQSFNNWGGISSLSGFDQFYGSENFCGQQNTIQMSGESLMCQSIPITVVQQQYAVIAEYAKKVLLTNVCEVESQAVVWGQFMGGLQAFAEDFMHIQGGPIQARQARAPRPPTFDSSIASKINELCDSSGNINTASLGFAGTSVGSSCVQINGLNWVSETSPQSVGQAWSDCQSVVSSCLSAPICPAVSSSVCESSSAPTIISGGTTVVNGGTSCEGNGCDSSSISDCGSSGCGSSIISSSNNSTLSGSSDLGNSTISDGDDDSDDGIVPLDGSSNSTSTDDTSSSDSSTATESDGAVVALPTDASTTDSADAASPTDGSDAAISSSNSTSTANSGVVAL